MIRPKCEVECLTDDEFAKTHEPTEREIKIFLYNDFLYDFFAKCLSTDFKNDSIWEDSCLEYEYLNAMGFLSNISYYREIDVEKLKEVLEKNTR